MPARDWALIRKALINGDSYNSEVSAYFSDFNTDTEAIAVKNLCLVQSNDSALIAQQRIRFFREEIQKIHLKPTIIGQPKIDFDADVKYHPQVSIEFRQTLTSIPRGKYPKDARISWRLMNETSESLTFAKMNDVAALVYQQFFSNRFSFKKGKVIGWYLSPSDGLALQIYCLDAAEAERAAKYVVQAIGKTWNNSIFKTTNPNRTNVPSSEQITILGKQKDAPIWRPSITVNAYKANINVWGAGNEDFELVGRLANGQFFAIARKS
ncbi:MAG: hypothetical protein V7L00_27110 [Nostoc sp.]|uniref:hypothetical protein n=1 Tax=Nostoc sp. TaxID=1180 RepID=UPI002FF51D36